MSSAEELGALREQEYRWRREADRLRAAVYALADPGASGDLLRELYNAEGKLAEATRLLEGSLGAGQAEGVIINSHQTSSLLGPKTTGLDVKVELRMAHIPTAVYHLLSAEETPLVTFTVRNADTKLRRVRVTTRVEGYSAPAVDTMELAHGVDGRTVVNHLPTIFPARLTRVSEITRATISVLIEDLDSQAGPYNGRVELHRTSPVWLLARTTAPLRVRDPAANKSIDLSRYLGAFVTPNDPRVRGFVGEAAAFAPPGGFVGYQNIEQGNEPDEAIVTAQVGAMFNALREKARITYVNSYIAINPEEGVSSQRVRLPAETLLTRQANCVDGTVLFASLLEAVSLNPAIVIVPGHTLVGWETWEGSGQWKYLETTMIGSGEFERASMLGDSAVQSHREIGEALGNPDHVRQWPLRDLRAKHRVMPMQ